MSIREALLYMSRYIPDKIFIKLKYFIRMHKWLKLKNPQTFNEKLQWLKLYDKNPIYCIMVDKYESKKFFLNKIGEKYIIPTIGVFEKWEEIDFTALPNKFVIKTTHDSGGVVICKDKSKFNYDEARRKIQKSIYTNYFYHNREWPYKGIKPRIIIEKYLDALGSDELVEYKIFCFSGIPKFFLVCKGAAHKEGRTNDFYDLNFNHIPVTVTNPNAESLIERPVEYNELIEIAKKISQGIPQLRVDTYVVNGKIYIGETTFFHEGGYCKFNPSEYDIEFGKLIVLPNIERETLWKRKI